MQNEPLVSFDVIPAETEIHNIHFFENWIPDDCLGNDTTVFCNLITISLQSENRLTARDLSPVRDVTPEMSEKGKSEISPCLSR